MWDWGNGSPELLACIMLNYQISKRSTLSLELKGKGLFCRGTKLLKMQLAGSKIVFLTTLVKLNVFVYIGGDGHLMESC